MAYRLFGKGKRAPDANLTGAHEWQKRGVQKYQNEKEKGGGKKETIMSHEDSISAPPKRRLKCKCETFLKVGHVAL